MKKIFISQRVDIISDYNERRDALDQRWTWFLRETGAIPFPMPNDAQHVLHMLKFIRPDGILLTGGNSPVDYGGNASERDLVDKLLIEFSLEHKIPLIGICRGMQSVVLFFGGSLKEVSDHVATRHKITGSISRIVNSYHGLAVDAIPENFNVLTHSDDGIIEAIRHTSLPIYAFMWHPEREVPYLKDDVELFKNIWNGGEI